eukprot:6196534-Pleurochrysis_carterae.AAC.1
MADYITHAFDNGPFFFLAPSACELHAHSSTYNHLPVHPEHSSLFSSPGHSLPDHRFSANVCATLLCVVTTPSRESSLRAEDVASQRSRALRPSQMGLVTSSSALTTQQVASTRERRAHAPKRRCTRAHACTISSRDQLA